jgi:hypothetical protein
MEKMFCFKSRKICNVGYTMYVTLPLDWLAFNDIGKGSSLKMVVVDGGRGLKLVPEKEEYHEETSG